MRTFVEISLDEQTKRQIADCQHALQVQLESDGAPACLRWPAAESIHLTLRFLGETGLQQQALLAHDLALLAEQWPQFHLQVNGLGGFPDVGHPNVVWLGVEGDMDTLRDLQSEVERLAQAADFEPDNRAFSPHLTIARTSRRCSRREVRAVGKLLQEIVEGSIPGCGPIEFTAERIVHMRSELEPSGAVYTPLSTHTLRT